MSDATLVTGDDPRVALIASSYAPHIGGVETHVQETARGLQDEGTAVEVWAVDRGQRLREASSFPVRYLPTPLPARSAADFTRFAARAPGAWRRWTRTWRSFRPDVLHVQCFGPNGLYALALHRRFGTPLVISSHGETRGDDGSAFDRSALLRRGLRESIARASAVTAPSRYVLDDLRDRFGLGEGVVVPNGATPPSPLPVRDEQDMLLAIGRLGRMKGFDLLLDAFALAQFDRPMTLVIAGDGDERSALEAQAARLGIADRVGFPGWWNASQKTENLARALALVVPSRSEAFGIAALEAWASGTPLVMTTRGGAPEFLSDRENALLVDPTEAHRFARTLEEMAGDPRLRGRLADAGREAVREYSWGRVVADYRRIYAEVAAGSSVP